jgi:hypothetical protein
VATDEEPTSTVPAGYTHTGGDLFTEVDVRGNGHRDFFAGQDGLSTFPEVPNYIIHEVGGPEPPGPPSEVRAERDPVTGKLVVAWPYNWGAARYEVWRSTAVGKLGSTRPVRKPTIPPSQISEKTTQ